MAKLKVQELEDTILDQIEKLNQDDILDEPEKAKVLIDRSNAMASLAKTYIEVNRMKLDVVKELNKGGTLYESYLGIESKTKVGKV